MSDTFIGTVYNLTEAYGDITVVYVADKADATNYLALVENGTVNFDPVSIGFVVHIKNTGEKDGTFTVTFYRDNVQTETATVSITAGATAQQSFTNGTAGYNNPDGETHTYKATVTP